MSQNLMVAHKEWRERPADQRFQSLDALHAAVLARKQASTEYASKLRDVRLVIDQVGGVDEVKVATPVNEFGFSNWSFGQLSKAVGAPADYLKDLPADLLKANLDHGLASVDQARGALVFGSTGQGGGTLMALTSQKYARIWDADLVEAIMRATDGTTWRPPLGYRDGRFGAEMVPSGLYASDRDVFMFLVEEDHPIEVGGDVLNRGVIVRNSEVGSEAFGVMTFLYRRVCGNNIVWGAQQVQEFRQIHIGNRAGSRAIDHLNKTLTAYAGQSSEAEASVIRLAQGTTIGKDHAEAVAWLRAKGFSRDLSEKAVTVAALEEGDRRTVWTMVQGLTAVARTLPNTDVRVALEKQAGLLLDQLAA